MPWSSSGGTDWFATGNASANSHLHLSRFVAVMKAVRVTLAVPVGDIQSRTDRVDKPEGSDGLVDEAEPDSG